jgi:hypothetical protein
LEPKITKLSFGFETFWRQNFEKKMRSQNVDEIDGSSTPNKFAEIS